MGSSQSAEQTNPEVVRIDRNEIPEEYKTVGVSSDVVKRVNATKTSSPSAGSDNGENIRLRQELQKERDEKAKLREDMAKLSQLQQRKDFRGVSSPVGGIESDLEDRKKIFDETVERVQKLLFPYHRENVCQDNENEIVKCLQTIQEVICSNRTEIPRKYRVETSRIENSWWCHRCEAYIYAEQNVDRILAQHVIKKHSDKTLYQCKKCGAGYNRLDDMKHHLKIHGDVYSFLDREMECNEEDKNILESCFPEKKWDKNWSKVDTAERAEKKEEEEKKHEFSLLSLLVRFFLFGYK